MLSQDYRDEMVRVRLLLEQKSVFHLGRSFFFHLLEHILSGRFGGVFHADFF